MNTILLRRSGGLLLLLIGLLGGCRSQQPVFRFRPQLQAPDPATRPAPPGLVPPDASGPQVEAKRVLVSRHPVLMRKNVSAARRGWPARNTGLSPVSAGRQVRQIAGRNSLGPSHQARQRPVAPVLGLVGLGVLALLIGSWIGTLNAIALGFIIGLGFVVLALLLLLARTLWPQSAAQVRWPGRGIRLSSWLQALGWTLGLGGIGLGLVLGGWLGLLVALVLAAAGLFVGLFGSLSNGNLP